MSDAAVKMVCDTVLTICGGGVSLFFFLLFTGCFDKD